MAGLNIIALISGGKDSLFSILHCLAQGHKLVALANLYPQRTNDEDTDSHMYQTIGHKIILLYEEALEVPLYRAPIQGGAVSTSQTYRSDVQSDSSREDEIESLIPLLREVMAKHPEANALSTGAILSTYQRTRVESVALRLNLIPLAYLWQYPHLAPERQSSLLDDMAAVCQDARIIKVASGGLDERHLWLNIADPKTVSRLLKDMSRFGVGEVGAVLGEGGEFETLTLDGPSALWKGQIVIDESERTTMTDEGGSACLHVTGGKVLKKDPNESSTSADLSNLRMPPLWDSEFDPLLQCERTDALRQIQKAVPNLPDRQPPQPLSQVKECRWQSESCSSICNLSAPDADGVSAQTQAIIQTLHTWLQELQSSSHNTTQITHTTILLRHITSFPTVNKIYSTLFPLPNPPARVTVACGDRMPPGVEVMVSAIAHSFPTNASSPEGSCSPHARKALHVQSRSYWAPANIGPYSQAVSVPFTARPASNDDNESRSVYIAGQIPLHPASMELISPSFPEQAVLSLQHLFRVGRAMGVSWFCGVVVYITAADIWEARERARVVGRLWRRAHSRVGGDGLGRGDGGEGESEEGAEVEDIAERSVHRSWNVAAGVDPDVTPRVPLPDWSCVRNMYPGMEQYPPVVSVQVAELPREASIEWTGTGIVTGSRNLEVTSGGVEFCGITRDGASAQRFYEEWPESPDHLEEKDDGSGGARGGYDVFAAQSPPESLVEDCHGMVVPCKAVFDENGKDYAGCVSRRRTGS